ncbi:hypothetical protein LTR17_020943 [Elasticomyces elasticus]|nr:hypothetical protein LTR17_020943 [Elasticomyces elasticus]
MAESNLDHLKHTQERKWTAVKAHGTALNAYGSKMLNSADTTVFGSDIQDMIQHMRKADPEMKAELAATNEWVSWAEGIAVLEPIVVPPKYQDALIALNVKYTSSLESRTSTLRKKTNDV